VHIAKVCREPWSFGAVAFRERVAPEPTYSGGGSGGVDVQLAREKNWRTIHCFCKPKSSRRRPRFCSVFQSWLIKSSARSGRALAEMLSAHGGTTSLETYSEKVRDFFLLFFAFLPTAGRQEIREEGHKQSKERRMKNVRGRTLHAEFSRNF